jgi:hypothetical protein
LFWWYKIGVLKLRFSSFAAYCVQNYSHLYCPKPFTDQSKVTSSRPIWEHHGFLMPRPRANRLTQVSHLGSFFLKYNFSLFRYNMRNCNLSRFYVW